MAYVRYKTLRRWEKAVSYVVLLLTALVCGIFFCLLNRTHVHGWLNFSRRRPTILLPNHTTMIDSFPVEFFAAFPWALVIPGVLAYHPAATENFFSNPVLAWFSRMWRCIPINQSRKDPTAMRFMAGIVATNPLVVFPEGTRSRDGTMGEGRIGVGKLILDTRPQVVPVYVSGMEKVLQIGSRTPRLFKRLDVYFGQPMDLSPYRARPNDRAASQQIVNQVMDEIRLLKEKHLAYLSLSRSQRARVRSAAAFASLARLFRHGEPDG